MCYRVRVLNLIRSPPERSDEALLRCHLRQSTPRVPFLLLCDPDTSAHNVRFSTKISRSIAACLFMSNMLCSKTTLIAVKTLPVRSSAAPVIASAKPSSTLKSVNWLCFYLQRPRACRRGTTNGSFIRFGIFVPSLIWPGKSVDLIRCLGWTTEFRFCFLIRHIYCKYLSKIRRSRVPKAHLAANPLNSEWNVSSVFPSRCFRASNWNVWNVSFLSFLNTLSNSSNTRGYPVAARSRRGFRLWIFSWPRSPRQR